MEDTACKPGNAIIPIVCSLAANSQMVLLRFRVSGAIAVVAAAAAVAMPNSIFS